MRSLVAAAVALAACGGEPIRGGSAVPGGAEPDGRVIESYRPKGCQDASGGAARSHARVFVIAVDSRTQALVETRPGYDSLLVENYFADGDQTVFQIIAGTTLREYRFPSRGRGPGLLTVARRWDEQPTVDGGFVAQPRDRVLGCPLVSDPDPPLDKAPPAGNTPGP